MGPPTTPGPQAPHHLNPVLFGGATAIAKLLGCLPLRSSGGRALAARTAYTFDNCLSRQLISLSEAIIFFWWRLLQPLFCAHVTNCVSPAGGILWFDHSKEPFYSLHWRSDTRVHVFQKSLLTERVHIFSPAPRSSPCRRHRAVSTRLPSHQLLA